MSTPHLSQGEHLDEHTYIEPSLRAPLTQNTHTFTLQSLLSVDCEVIAMSIEEKACGAHFGRGGSGFWKIYFPILYNCSFPPIDLHSWYWLSPIDSFPTLSENL